MPNTPLLTITYWYNLA